MVFSYTSVLDFGLERSAEVFTRGFSDYFVRIVGSPALLVEMARVDGVDLSRSQVVLADGAAVGAALIARRGWTSRLAGMAVAPEARRRGAGRALVAHVLGAARAGGERAMVLEVIEQNEPAVRLYESLGFQRVRRLVGFSRSASAAADAGARDLGLQEVDVREVAAQVRARGLPDLPWQLSGETLAQLGPPHRGFRLGEGWIVVGDSSAATMGIRALVVGDREDPKDAGVALIRAVQARFPGKEWRLGALWPEELAGVFLAADFSRTPLTQWQMERRFCDT